MQRSGPYVPQRPGLNTGGDGGFHDVAIFSLGDHGLPCTAPGPAAASTLFQSEDESPQRSLLQRAVLFFALFILAVLLPRTIIFDLSRSPSVESSANSSLPTSQVTLPVLARMKTERAPAQQARVQQAVFPALGLRALETEVRSVLVHDTGRRESILPLTVAVLYRETLLGCRDMTNFISDKFATVFVMQKDVAEVLEVPRLFRPDSTGVAPVSKSPHVGLVMLNDYKGDNWARAVAFAYLHHGGIAVPNGTKKFDEILRHKVPRPLHEDFGDFMMASNCDIIPIKFPTSRMLKPSVQESFVRTCEVARQLRNESLFTLAPILYESQELGRNKGRLTVHGDQKKMRPFKKSFLEEATYFSEAHAVLYDLQRLRQNNCAVAVDYFRSAWKHLQSEHTVLRPFLKKHGLRAFRLQTHPLFFDAAGREAYQLTPEKQTKLCVLHWREVSKHLRPVQCYLDAKALNFPSLTVFCNEFIHAHFGPSWVPARLAKAPMKMKDPLAHDLLVYVLQTLGYELESENDSTIKFRMFAPHWAIRHYAHAVQLVDMDTAPLNDRRACFMTLRNNKSKLFGLRMRRDWKPRHNRTLTLPVGAIVGLHHQPPL
ncbi:MAG: hypothetical protein MHM6MM_000192 [Cercozoa sp. M6MM]